MYIIKKEKKGDKMLIVLLFGQLNFSFLLDFYKNKYFLFNIPRNKTVNATFKTNEIYFNFSKQN